MVNRDTNTFLERSVKARKTILKLALCASLFQFSSCEKEPTAVPDTTSATEEVTKASGYTLEAVDRGEIPEITDFLKARAGKDLFKKSTSTDKGNGPILEEDILAVVDSIGTANYSFRFTFPDTPDNEFYNLVVGKTSDGSPEEPQVYHYISDPEYFGEFKDSGFDPLSFVGTVQIYPFNSIFKDGAMDKSTCSRFYNNGDPIPCIRTRVSYGSSGSRGPGRGNSTQGGFARPTLASYSLSVTVYHIIPGGRVYRFGSNSVCQHPGECQIIYETSNARTRKMADRGCAGCPSYRGGIALNTGSRNRYIVNNIKKKISLSRLEENLLKTNSKLSSGIYTFLSKNKWNTASKTFIKNSVRDLTKIPGWKRDKPLKALYIVLEAEKMGAHYYDGDSRFANIVNKYNRFTINRLNNLQVGIWFMMRCAELRALHPNWSEWKILWEASKDFIHLTLDVVGMVPGVGEAADLVNGALYFAEGDAVNGTLSLSAAIPFAGWTATTAKWAIKCTRFADGTKIALHIVKRSDGILEFGRKGSKNFRKQLGLKVGNTNRAHHVIPWNLNEEKLVQAAAKWKWHPHDAALNGKAVSYKRHKGSHDKYDKQVQKMMKDIVDEYPGILKNPKLAYQKLRELSVSLQRKIDSKPNTKINELF